MTVGQKLREYRKELGYTQVQMSVECGISYPTYTDIEQGRRNTTIDTIRRICNYLGITLSEFFENVD